MMMMMMISSDDDQTDHIFPFLSWELLNALLESAGKPVSDNNDGDFKLDH